jgi:alpha-beta hydrolase superfamily lysophospholipase
MAATFVPIHAAGDGAWSWHLVARELRQRGHDVVAVDLPADDESAGLWDYADAVVDAIGSRPGVTNTVHGDTTARLPHSRR